MSHTTSDARKRRDSTAVAHQPGWSKEPHPGAKEDCDRCAFVAPDQPTVPRLARSVDDLRVGMVVAWRSRLSPEDHGWCLAEVTRPGEWEPRVRGRLVILSDPPARDWLVPATQMERLREALQGFDPGFDDTYDAARAVLDAAREVEHE